MLIFLQILCAYFAVVGILFLAREVYISLSGTGAEEYARIYIAAEGESEEKAREELDKYDPAGRVIIIYGDGKSAEEEIAALCRKHGRIYVKR